MKNKIFRITIQTIIIMALLINILSINVCADEFNWVESTQVNQSTLKANKGSNPTFYYGVFIIDNWINDWNGHIWATGTLYESDQVTKLTEIGWTQTLYSHFQKPDGTTQEVSSTTASNGYYCRFSKDIDDIHESHISHSMWVWYRLHIPSTTTRSVIYVKAELGESHVKYVESTSGSADYYTIGIQWFKLTIETPPSPYYNIDLSATPIRSEIEPEETLVSTLTIYNNGTKILPLGVYYETDFYDSIGNNIDMDDNWKMEILDTARSDMFYITVPAQSSRQLYFEVTSPERSDAPPNSDLTITLKAVVLNDTTYGDEYELTTATNDDFTGDGVQFPNIDWGDIASLDWTSPYVLGVIAIIVIIIIILGLMYFKPRAGRKKRKGRN